MEQSVNTYTKEEKADAFEYVNNVFLHLKGDEKRRLKRAMTHTWKQNKTIGCLELFMKLYTCYDVYDKDNEWFKKYLNDNCETEEDYKNKKISLAKHRRIVGRRQEDNDELQEQLEQLEEAKGYMKEDEHNDIIRDIKRSHNIYIEEIEDNCMKKVNQISLEAEKYRSRLETANSQVAYYKKLCEDLEKELKD